MNKAAVLAAALLAAGLLVGFGAGALVSPFTTTATRYETVTTAVTAFSTIVSRAFSPTTVTSTFTERIAATRTVTTTDVRTAFVTVATTVYPAASGPLLLSERGSGTKETVPFTLDRASDLRLKVRVTARAELRYVTLSWFLYPVGGEAYSKRGEVNQEQGVFEFYLAGVRPGNWYVRVLAANCDWELTLERVT